MKVSTKSNVEIPLQELFASNSQHVPHQISGLSISHIIEKPFSPDQVRSIAKAVLDSLDKENDRNQ
jgi:hypothetical protein